MIKIRSYILAPVAIGVFVAGILVSMALNIWQTESTKIPASFTSGEYEGIANPADIRGSYTLEDITRSFDVPAEILIQAFALPEETDPAAFRINEFEELYLPLEDGSELGTDSVRLFVARYLGLPYEPEETTRLLSPALALLRDKLATADFDLLKPLALSPAELPLVEELDPEAAAAVAEEHEEMESEAIVKGKTSFYDLLDWGLSKEQITEVLGLEMGPTAMPVKDFCLDHELDFGTIKEKLQVLLDAMNIK